VEKSRLLRNEISLLAKSFPADEKYRLADQIIRSSRSIGNNIAEAQGSFHYIDAAKFLVNARGSITETIDHLIIALDEKFIDEKMFERLKAICDYCMRLTNGYINYLRQQKNKEG